MRKLKKCSTASTLNKTEIPQGERELSMEYRVMMTGMNFLKWKISFLYFWTEDWNIDDVTLEDTVHLISFDLYMRMCVLERDSMDAGQICRKLTNQNAYVQFSYDEDIL
jgi:hypothetical protein